MLLILHFSKYFTSEAVFFGQVPHERGIVGEGVYDFEFDIETIL